MLVVVAQADVEGKARSQFPVVLDKEAVVLGADGELGSTQSLRVAVIAGVGTKPGLRFGGVAGATRLENICKEVREGRVGVDAIALVQVVDQVVVEQVIEAELDVLVQVGPV